MNKIDNKKILEYLYFGYSISNGNGLFVEKCLRSLPENCCYNPQDAGRLFDSIFDYLLTQTTQKGFLVVPISGGMDSRFVLGALRERFDSREIKTVTFGVPGQHDYTIGKLVSKSVGVENFSVDLSGVELCWDVLLSSVKEAPWTYVPDAFFNRLCIERSGIKHANMISGFLGDPLTGSHISMASTVSEVYFEFIARQRRVRSVCLVPENFNPNNSISFLSSGAAIDLSHILDLSIRQANCIAPIVTPLKRWNEWNIHMGSIQSCAVDVFAPFVHPAWAAYWLIAPRKYKLDQMLYKQLLHYKFPRLWGLPRKDCLGLSPKSTLLYRLAQKKRYYQIKISERFPRLGLAPTAHMNYLDFATAFRKRPDCQALLDTALEYLREHQVVPWLQVSSLKAQHMSGMFNHADALLVLVGLALNLKNMESNPAPE